MPTALAPHLSDLARLLGVVLAAFFVVGADAARADTTPPVMYLYDHSNIPVTDSDPYTAPGASVGFGMTVPQGACGRQDRYVVYGFDDLDGFIIAPDAVTAVVITDTGLVPGTSVRVLFDVNSTFPVDIHWGFGTSTVQISMKDAAGNTASVTITMTLEGDASRCTGSTTPPPCDPGGATCTGETPAVCVAGGTLFTVAVNGPTGVVYAVCSVVPAGYAGATTDTFRCEGASGPGDTPTLFTAEQVASQFGTGFCGGQ